MTGTVHHHRLFGMNYSGIVAKKIVDMDGDGRQELLAFVDTGWGLTPRGVCRFDFSSGCSRWLHEIAPTPWAMETLDLDGGGKLGVIVGSNSTSNGNRLPDGTDDSHCYLYAVSQDGRPLWTREVGTHHVRATPLVVKTRSANKPRLYAWLAAAAENREREVGEIIELDYLGNVVSRYDAGAYLLSCLAADLNDDGTDVILASDRLGRLHELNPDLTLRRKVTVATPRFTSVELKLVAVTNLTGRAAKQIVLTSAHHEVGSGRNLGNDRVTVNVRFWHDLSVVVLDVRLRTRPAVSSRNGGPTGRAMPPKSPTWIAMAGRKSSGWTNEYRS